MIAIMICAMWFCVGASVGLTLALSIARGGDWGDFGADALFVLLAGALTWGWFFA